MISTFIHDGEQETVRNDLQDKVQYGDQRLDDCTCTCINRTVVKEHIHVSKIVFIKIVYEKIQHVFTQIYMHKDNRFQNMCLM